MRTVLLDLGPLAHLAGVGALVGTSMSDSDSLVSSAGKGIVVVNGVIESIQESSALEEEYGAGEIHSDELRVISLEGHAVIPGLVDGHNHLIWAGDRSNELTLKQQGRSYQEIAALGGGIQHTVRQTEQASDEQLIQLSYQRMRTALHHGTTHMETKSGYGLSTKSELTLLRVAHQLSQMSHLPSMELTWLGAHDTPKGMTRSAYVEEILSEQLPSVIEQGYAHAADVFCEPGWFTPEESEEILVAARNGGLTQRIHIDEFTNGGGGELAADLKVVTADHSHYTPDETRMRMEAAGVNTGFLPGTPYTMGAAWPSFNQTITNECRWSIATDFNPNCNILSLPFIGSLLVHRNKVDPLATLVAASRNPSETTPHPTGLTHGRIEVGAVANLNVLNGVQWESWCNQPGTSPFKATMLSGELHYH
ncbi:imidazolonepropionase [Candidatus Poseidoniales archaeon]|nr:imidazolonepropionase [Candidatus Poseidoniales archaeon]